MLEARITMITKLEDQKVQYCILRKHIGYTVHIIRQFVQQFHSLKSMFSLDFLWQ